jgi:hypothetical protein
MERKRGPRNKPHSYDSQQRFQKHTLEKREPLQQMVLEKLYAHM